VPEAEGRQARKRDREHQELHAEPGQAGGAQPGDGNGPGTPVVSAHDAQRVQRQQGGDDIRVDEAKVDAERHGEADQGGREQGGPPPAGHLPREEEGMGQHERGDDIEEENHAGVAHQRVRHDEEHRQTDPVDFVDRTGRGRLAQVRGHPLQPLAEVGLAEDASEVRRPEPPKALHGQQVVGLVTNQGLAPVVDPGRGDEEQEEYREDSGGQVAGRRGGQDLRHPPPKDACLDEEAVR